MKYIKYLTDHSRIILVGLLLLSGVVGVAAVGQTVYAWGCEEDATFTDRCFAENWELIQSIAEDRGINEDRYEEMARECLTGNPARLDFGTVDEGECINAAAFCIQRSIDINRCNANNMAEIAVHCNDGIGIDATGSCGRVNDMNYDALGDMQNTVAESAAGTCVVSGSPTEQFDQAEACKKAVLDACKDVNPRNGRVGSNKNYDQYGAQQYQECLNEALVSTAKNAEECENRKGLSVTSQGSGTTAPTSFECVSSFEDITNKQSCEENGGTWIGGTDGAQAPRCAPPAPPDPCADRGGVNPDDPTKCNDGSDAKNEDPKPSGGVDPITDRCGEARVNILVCGEEGGNTALNNILRIAAIVLSIVVGIAAVGGIAWASVLYAKAQDNEGNVSEAKTLIQNVVIGLMLYVLLVALVNWLVPGGVFG